MDQTIKQLSTEEYFAKADQIMQSFDFKKVHAYMTLTKWTWYNHKTGEVTLPTLKQLEETAYTFLHKAILDDVANCGTGGFTVYKFPYGLVLSFEPFKASSF